MTCALPECERTSLSPEGYCLHHWLNLISWSHPHLNLSAYRHLDFLSERSGAAGPEILRRLNPYNPPSVP